MELQEVIRLPKANLAGRPGVLRGLAGNRQDGSHLESSFVNPIRYRTSPVLPLELFSFHRATQLHSAFRLTRVVSCSDPASCLFAALNELLRAVDGRVVLLRPLTECFDGQRDDIDLLLTESQREQLLRAAFEHCMRGRIHCRIQTSTRTKVQLILWTIDCAQQLKVDLWSSFDQLTHQRRICIPAERLLNTLTAAVHDAQIRTSYGAHAADMKQNESPPGHAYEKIPALRQLPPDIDLCLLLQHLATKRRILTTTAVQERIGRACERLASWLPEPATLQVPDELQTALRHVAHHLPGAIVITPKSIVLSEEYLLQRLACVRDNRGLPVLERRRWRGLMTGLRKSVLRHRPTVALIGSDGAGKSSVVSALALQNPQTTTAVAKKLYRRSLTYQFISALMKRLRGTERDMFDDRTAPLITLRALVALWINIFSSLNPWTKTTPSVAVENERLTDHGPNELPRTTILDRSIASFLITERKSDIPLLARGARWIEALIPPVTSVLLTLPYSELTLRKQEMSAPGHDTYQRMLFEQALRQQPTDLVVLANLPSVQAAATAICELLQDEGRSAESSTETAGNRTVAA